MNLNQELDALLAARNAKGICELAARVDATWFKRVAELRSEWLTNDIKSASDYEDTFDRLAKQAGTRQPEALLQFAAQKTASKNSLRKYRAAIRHVAAQPHREALKAALQEADRVNAKARKAAGKASWANEMAKIWSGIVYEKKLGPVVQALDGLSAVFESAAGQKPSGKRKERSHSQRSKLGRLPDDWQDKMLARMKRGVGKKEGKWAAHAAASVLVGLRPSELEGLTFYREGPLLVVSAKGAKVGKVRVPVMEDGKRVWKTFSSGRKEREMCFDLDKLKGSAHEAALQLYAKAPANGAVMTFEDVDGFGSAWRASAAREFGKKLAPSAYANRHQFASELKARGDEGEGEGEDGGNGAASAALRHEIAAALGHASTATQSVYGRPCHSKLHGLEGLVSVSAAGHARNARPPAPPSRKIKFKGGGGGSVGSGGSRASAPKAPK